VSTPSDDSAQFGRQRSARSVNAVRTQAAARRARDEWLAATGEEHTARSWTVERWLRHWLTTRTHLRPTSVLHYTRDVEQVLILYRAKTRSRGVVVSVRPLGGTR